MKTISYCVVAILLAFSLSSCKRVTKFFTKNSAAEMTEKATKETSEEIVYGIGENAIRRMDVDELIEFIRKNNGPLANSFERLDKSFQKGIKDAIDKDVNFLNHLLCSETLLDDFADLVKNAPKASKDVNLLKMYAKTTYDARRYCKSNVFNDVTLKELDGVTVFMHKANNMELARAQDGVVEFANKAKDINSFMKTNVMNTDLLPNSVYKMKGENGLSLIVNVDNFGRVSNIKFAGGVEELDNVFKANQDIFLGVDWDEFVRKSSNSSKGNYSVTFSYNGRKSSPEYISVKPQKASKKQKESFKNIARTSDEVFSEADNIAIVERYAKQLNLSNQQYKELLEAINNSNGLANLVHQNPVINIQRWLNTRNPVDKSKLAVTPNGSYPVNSELYAGNVYYFNPYLNPNLLDRMKSGNGVANLRGWDVLTEEDLMYLDKLYPDGVPFTKEGFPDFSKLAYKDKNGQMLSIDVGSIGDSNVDRQKAERIFKSMGHKEEGGYTWHHVEKSTSLIRVPAIIHALVDHSGGISMAK